MSATAAQIAKVRRMVAEPTAGTYTDQDIAEYIEARSCIDERGEEPYSWDTSSEPPTQEANDAWIDTYDLNAAAADIWNEKAAALAATYYDFGADGQTFNRSQAAQQALQMARYYWSRRNAKTISARLEPEPPYSLGEEV